MAEANGYRMLAMGVGARTGHGIWQCHPRARSPSPKCCSTSMDTAALAAGGGKAAERRARRAWLLLSPQDDGRRFHRELRRLQRKRPKLLLFTIMRKLEDAPFKTPIQLRYAEDIGDESGKGIRHHRGGRCMTTVLDCLTAAHLQREPFDHYAIEGALPEPLFKELAEASPASNTWLARTRT